MNRFGLACCLLLTSFAAISQASAADTVLVEAESFHDRGGWMLDTQFVQIMGSPYLLAHGLGQPVADAKTNIELPGAGTYKVFVRTKDWVARWKAPGQPGRFQVLVNDKPLSETFGVKGADWFWQDGGTVEVTDPKITIALHDLTGFDGRCDAIVLTKDQSLQPPSEAKELSAWRKKMLGLPDKPVEAGTFDLVVVGGGYAGMGAAISGARMGCKVALIQDRPVLGGNGSSEIRVWSQGGTTLGKYPKLGEIVEEFSDHAKESPGTAAEFGDEKKEAIVRAEKNITLYLNTQASGIEMKDGHIVAVLADDMNTGAETRFAGKLFVDCTGHATIGALAGADFDMLESGHMGMSNMWRWDEADQARTFPATPWALPLTMKDFPYPNRGKAEWFWEGGFKRDPIKDLEYIRDWNLRAIFGAFNAMKNGDGKDKHVNAEIQWVAYVGGNRESRLLRGDIVLTREEIIGKKDFPDGCVPTTWDIDLHEPKEQYAKKFPDDPFISKAIFDSRVDKANGYPVPYRCFYSRNIPNLFMAGRDISVDHGALGTIRVMRTCGMMGEVVGKAASICVLHECTPREVYTHYLDDLKKLMELPGKARRETVNDEIRTDVPLSPASANPAPPHRPKAAAKQAGIDPKTLPGIVVVDSEAKLTGAWKSGTGLKNFIGAHYLYDDRSGNGACQAKFEFRVPKDGTYEVRFAYTPYENRATNVPVTVVSAEGSKTIEVNEQTDPPLAASMISLGSFRFEAATDGVVSVTNRGAKGVVTVNAVQVIPSP